MTHDQSVLAENIEREARIVAEARETKKAQLTALDRVLSSVGLCAECGKSRALNVVPGKHGRCATEVPSPQTHCTCPRWGVVDRPDEWRVEFARGYQGAAIAVLHPANRAYGAATLRPCIAPGDTEPQGPMRFISSSRAFAWAEVSPAARRLAVSILALVAGIDRADRWADAFVAEWLAVKIAKDSPRTQSITLGEVRQWLASHEATSAGAVA